MNDLTFTGLRVISQVAASGSISAAAATLGYTQSGISRQLAAMEKAAGTALFERHPRGVQPTPAGAVLVRHALALLHGAETAVAEIAAMLGLVTGTVTVGAFPTGQVLLVPRAVVHMRAEHPSATVRIREGSSADQIRHLRDGHLDVAVVAYQPDFGQSLDGLLCSPILEGQMLVAVPPGHPLSDRDSLTLDDLSCQSWIVGGSGTGDAQFGPWAGATDPEIAYMVRHWPERLGFVAAGLGLAVVPASIAAVLLPGGIRAIPVADPDRPHPMVLGLTRPNPTPITCAFMRSLKLVASNL